MTENNPLKKMESLQKSLEKDKPSPAGPSTSLRGDSEAWVLLLPSLSAISLYSFSLILFASEYTAPQLWKLQGFWLLSLAPHLAAAVIASTAWISLWVTKAPPIEWTTVRTTQNSPILLATPRKIDKGIKCLLKGVAFALVPYLTFSLLFLGNLCLGTAGLSLITDPLFLEVSLFKGLSASFLLSLPALCLLTAGVLKKISPEENLKKVLVASALTSLGFLLSPNLLTAPTDPTAIETAMPWACLVILYWIAIKVALTSPHNTPQTPAGK